MSDYVFRNKTDLVNYLLYKLNQPSPVKIQKTLYLLFAFYGATYGQLSHDTDNGELGPVNYPASLFEPHFEAWKYGPVDPNIHRAYRSSQYTATKLTEDALNENLTSSEEQNIMQFIGNIIQQINDTDDFALIGRTCEDTTWHEAYENHTLMNPQAVIDEYVSKYV